MQDGDNPDGRPSDETGADTALRESCRCSSDHPSGRPKRLAAEENAAILRNVAPELNAAVPLDDPHADGGKYGWRP